MIKVVRDKLTLTLITCIVVTLTAYSLNLPNIIADTATIVGCVTVLLMLGRKRFTYKRIKQTKRS